MITVITALQSNFWICHCCTDGSNCNNMNNPTHFSLHVQIAYPLTIWGVMLCHRVDRYLCGGNLMPPIFSAGSLKMMMTMNNLKSRLIPQNLPNCSDKSTNFPSHPVPTYTVYGIQHYSVCVQNIRSKVKHLRIHSMSVVSFGEIRLVMAEPIYYMWGMTGRCSVQGQSNLTSSLLNLTENIFLLGKDTKMYHWVNSSLFTKRHSISFQKTWIFSNTAIKTPSLECWQLGFHGRESLPLTIMWTHSCGQLWHSKLLLLPYITACCHRSPCWLTPQRRIHCEKLLVPQVVMKFPEFYGTQSFSYAFSYIVHSTHYW
jgi:hypothetical protein